MVGNWLPVHAYARWRKPLEEHTTNVGDRVLVLGFEMGPNGPVTALIVRSQYMGSGHGPLIETFTEVVAMDRIRMVGPSERGG